MIIYTHPACLLHDPGPEHPERPARLEVVLEALRAHRADADWREAPIVKLGDLRRVHDDALVHEVLEADIAGYRMLDPDTVICPASRAAALRAAGAGVAAVAAVMNGDDQTAFCAVRPPGHHATGTAAMGFCLFNNIAVAAAYACDKHGLERVAVIDFDVHHGNGTQDLLWDEPRATFVSTHQSPLYPGSGMRAERGAHGQIVNIPLPPGTTGAAYREVFDSLAMPALRAAAPELILVSAGFDAHRDDPLAQMGLTAADFGWITGRLCDVAEECCAGRLVSVLEGGYDLDALADSVAAHVGVLLARGA